MSIIKTRSGPATVLFYGIQGLVTADSDFNLNRAGSLSIPLEKEQQLQDASVRFEREQFELKTQQSSKAVEYKSVGIEPMLELSIADITFKNLRLGLGQSLNYTANTDVTRPSKLAIADNVGEELVGTRVQILPFPYPRLYRLNYKSKGNNGEYYNPFHSGYEDLLTTGYSGILASTAGVGVEASVSEADEFIAWRESIITFPNASIVDINQTEFAFGLQTQQQIRLMLRGLPDPTNPEGARLVFGSINVI